MVDRSPFFIFFWGEYLFLDVWVVQYSTYAALWFFTFEAGFWLDYRLHEFFLTNRFFISSKFFFNSKCKEWLQNECSSSPVWGPLGKILYHIKDYGERLMTEKCGVEHAFSFRRTDGQSEQYWRIGCSRDFHISVRKSEFIINNSLY